MRTLAELKNVPVGEMTQDEQCVVMRFALQTLARELESNAAAIRKVLSETAEPCTCNAPGDVHALSCPQHPEHGATK